MNNVLQGFLKEATLLGAAKGVGKFTMKHPMLALGAPGIVIGTAAAAKSGYKRGRAGGEPARYLPAAFDPVSGRSMASRAAYINYNPHVLAKLNRQPSKRQKKRLHKHYKEKAFA